MSSNKQNLFIDELLNMDTNLPEDEPSPETEFNKTEIRKQFESTVSNLEVDISHIDLRLSHIQKFIVNFEGQIDQIRNIIKNTSDASKKASLYGILNNSIELNARYEEIYIKCLDLKQKYRRDQSDLNYKIVKLIELELSKIKEEEESLTPGRLAQMVNELSSTINKQSNREPEDTDLINDISSIHDDPKYKI